MWLNEQMWNKNEQIKQTAIPSIDHSKSFVCLFDANEYLQKIRKKKTN